MAKQHGIIPVTGTMGGITFVKTKDGFQARQKSSMPGSRIKTDPAFVRTRENISEFGRAGKASKLLRKALRALILRTADSRVTGRLTREMMKVIQSDLLNPRGQRSPQVGNVDILRNFEFNANARLEGTLVAPYSATIDRTTGIIDVQVPAFDPRLLIVAPPGATHARIVSGCSIIDFLAETHTSEISESAYIDLKTFDQPTIQFTVGLTPNSDQPIFVALGIEFYQLVNGQQYSLSNGAFNALSVVQASNV
jgi:hypothetical protein